jgi:hypothetical protein
MVSSRFRTALAFSLTLGFLVGLPFDALARGGTVGSWCPLCLVALKHRRRIPGTRGAPRLP